MLFAALFVVLSTVSVAGAVAEWRGIDVETTARRLASGALDRGSDEPPEPGDGITDWRSDGPDSRARRDLGADRRDDRRDRRDDPRDDPRRDRPREPARERPQSARERPPSDPARRPPSDPRPDERPESDERAAADGSGETCPFASQPPIKPLDPDDLDTGPDVEDLAAEISGQLEELQQTLERYEGDGGS